MRAGHEEHSELSGAMVGHFDNCLGCMACVTACPSGVQYDKLIEDTRAQVERKWERSGQDKWTPQGRVRAVPPSRAGCAGWCR